MERIRKKYICKEQIKKGISGDRDIVKFYKKNYSTALMIDQRVSEGIKVNFFKHKALTTTIPAQLVKKYKMPIVPVFIERFENIKFKITVQKPIYFLDDASIMSAHFIILKFLKYLCALKYVSAIWPQPINPTLKTLVI